MTERHTADTINDNDLDQLYDTIEKVRALHKPVGVVAAAEHGLPPDCSAGCGDWPCTTYTALTDQPGPAGAEATQLETTARVFAGLHQSAEQDVTRVINLYERWVQAGPPPLGVSLARWWDARLVELHEAIRPTDDQTKEH